MPKLNYDILLSHVAEAREELQRIESELRSGSKPDAAGLQVWFDHAYHHLNTAWNARHVGNKRGFGCADRDFNQWGRFPRDINFAKLDIPKRTPRR